MTRKKISTISNPRIAKRKSVKELKAIKMSYAKAASKTTGKPLKYYLDLYDYYKL
jgi:hypothetical protein|tara:strand:- start:611 stop:775 length:165 start_codon:yes stop_codon:yes gene_type:complete